MLSLRDSIRNIFKNEDIEGLIEQGAPHNEYDLEADKISSISNITDLEVENIVMHIKDTWIQSFCLDKDTIEMRMPLIKRAAYKICNLNM